MTTSPPPAEQNADFWREFLTQGHRRERLGRQVLRRIPHGPRCKLCAAPFGGPGAPVMRMIGKRPSDKNPTMCASCFTFMSSHHGGAEIDCTLLFADIRGSTTIAERMTATEFRDLIDRFYTVATAIVFEHDGAVDKFVGDELVATFFPLLSGEEHAARGVEAASALLRATGHADPGGPWVPLGAGVHTGPTWVGAVGDQARRELTILGDSVNTTARLASVASQGEILVTSDAAQAATLGPALPRRSLELKGKVETTEVVVIRIGPVDPT
jgi:adenylate cyclase